MVYFVLVPPFGFFRQKMFMKAERKEGGLLSRAIQCSEKFVNKLLLFNFIVECKQAMTEVAIFTIGRSRKISYGKIWPLANYRSQLLNLIYIFRFI